MENELSKTLSDNFKKWFYAELQKTGYSADGAILGMLWNQSVAVCIARNITINSEVHLKTFIDLVKSYDMCRTILYDSVRPEPQIRDIPKAPEGMPVFD